jgi:hypothetical protein
VIEDDSSDDLLENLKKLNYKKGLLGNLGKIVL